MARPYTFHRPVVKLGTSTLTAGSEQLSLARLADFVEQVAALQAAGLQPILVSSGAIAVGRQRLGLPASEGDVRLKQVLAAVGQSRLMHLYDQAFEFHGITCAQVLLTREDLAQRRRYLNARSTLLGLCDRGVVPIINENDVVAADEIKVGDNDRLSALVATLVDADLLVLVSDTPGLYDADPAMHPDAVLVSEVPVITDVVESWAGGSGTPLGTGGMATKIEAARLATAAGTEVRIVDGREPRVLLRVIGGESLGTRFVARTDRVEGRKRWILSGLSHPGRVIVDDGAARAVLERGASLLPAGITAVEGEFEQGDTIEIATIGGRKIAAGIVNYPSTDVRAIMGRRSGEIEQILSYSYGDSVVHRDNLAALTTQRGSVHAV
jgi:glutamate 5-kinase